MELLFIRHGHGEHLLEYPNRLHTLHPALTEYGEVQVKQLREQYTFSHDDLFVVSPTRRTIETAQILRENHKMFISPLVGPRMFPQNPESPELNCDQILTEEEVSSIYKEVEILDLGLGCWEKGINRLERELFEMYAKQLLEWCRVKQQRTIFISHDGTITNYRVLLGENGLTRNDFLGEAGVFKTNL